MAALIWAKISSQEDERGTESNHTPLTGTDSYACVEAFYFSTETYFADWIRTNNLCP